MTFHDMSAPKVDESLEECLLDEAATVGGLFLWELVPLVNEEYFKDTGSPDVVSVSDYDWIGLLEQVEAGVCRLISARREDATGAKIDDIGGWVEYAGEWHKRPVIVRIFWRVDIEDSLTPSFISPSRDIAVYARKGEDIEWLSTFLIHA